MLGFETIAKFISPKKAFSLVALHLASELKVKKISKFHLKMDALNKTVEFTAFDEMFAGGSITRPFEKGKKYIDIAMHYVKGQMPENSAIHVAVVQYDENKDSEAFLFFEQDGEKKSIKHKF